MKTSEHRREIVRKSREKNKHKNVDKKKASDNAYYRANRDAVRATQAKHKAANRERLNKQSQAINKARLETDPEFKLKCLMRTRVGNHLRGRCKKDGPTFQLIGCSPGELRAHLGDKPGQRDHIFALALYDAATEQHKMTRWENLQMLTSEENNEKNDRLPTKAMADKVPQYLWPAGVTYDMLPDIYPGWATALHKY